MGEAKSDYEPIPSMPGYEINPFGMVRHIARKRTVQPRKRDNNKKSLFICVTIGQKVRSCNVANLLHEVYGPGAASWAGLPEPPVKKSGRRKPVTRHYRTHTPPRGARRCHDCGRITVDYRCPTCWEKVRGFATPAPGEHETSSMYGCGVAIGVATTAI